MGKCNQVEWSHEKLGFGGTNSIHLHVEELMTQEISTKQAETAWLKFNGVSGKYSASVVRVEKVTSNGQTGRNSH
jgi:hypothetical protein